MATAQAKKHLYELNCEQQVLKTEFATKMDCLHAWHRRFGHRHLDSIKKLVSESLATGINIDNCNQVIFCDTCAKGKLARLPFPKASKTKTDGILDLVHSELCGPMQTQTPGGKRFILTLIDDYSRFCTVHLLAHKDEASDKVQEFVQFCSTKFGKFPKTIRTDRGGEYQVKGLQSFFKRNSIEHQTTASYSP